jgi:hypothetical protein
MSKLLKLMVIVAAVAAFGTVAVAEDFYVVKDAAGKMTVVDKKTDDVKAVAQGPFKTKADAEKAMKAAPADKKPVKLPDQGC